MVFDGIYTFTNVSTDTNVRAYKKGETIFVAPTYEAPGPFEHVRIRLLQFVCRYYVPSFPLQWELKHATAGYTIKNVGLDAFARADAAIVR
jgi:predicted nucleotidyltransferase